MAGNKRSILALPLSSSLPHHLAPDAATPSVDALFGLSKPFPPGEQRKVFQAPSMLRRSRGVSKGAAFAYVTPLLKEFPYEIRKPKKEAKQVDSDEAQTGAKGVTANGAAEEPEAVVDEADKESDDVTMEDIEAYLSTLEPSFDSPVRPAIAGNASTAPGFTSPTRKELYRTTRAELLSVSRYAAEECLPQLLVGKEGDAAWDELEKVISGELVVARPPGVRYEDGDEKISEMGFAPWSLAYAGHQFGSFAGQLGDGRAVSIISTLIPEDKLATGFNLAPPLLPSTRPNSSVELQLKGSGRTPFSRFADGLAVLRSTIREFLGAEAVHALGIPTSRGLAIVNAPGVNVARERREGAAVLGRINPGGWLRVGSLELPAWREDWEGLRRLVRYATKEVWGIGRRVGGVDGAAKGDEKGTGAERKSLAAALLNEVAHANAKMVAGWQAAGFMHGVINTDNVALSGTTIDYGPYAFMDVFDDNKVCNHSDDFGRYSYKNQPPMVLFAVRKLGEVLSEMIGAELSMAAKDDKTGLSEVEEGWAAKATKSQMEAWMDEGSEVVNEVQARFQGWFVAEYKALMRKKLGLKEDQSDDFSNLFTPLLSLLGDHALDYAHTLRRLAFAPRTDSTEDLSHFLNRLVPLDGMPAHQRSDAYSRWTVWLGKLERRWASEANNDDSEARKLGRLNANPRFVLRQWVLEETIKKAEEGGEEGKAQIEKVLAMARRPFEPYGEGADGFGEGVEGAACETVGKEVSAAERGRLCETGPKEMLGFQCSCSS